MAEYNAIEIFTSNCQKKLLCMKLLTQNSLTFTSQLKQTYWFHPDDQN